MESKGRGKFVSIDAYEICIKLKFKIFKVEENEHNVTFTSLLSV